MKMPVPMIAPTPREVSWTGPRIRRSRFSPAISPRRWLSDLVANSWFFMRSQAKVYRATLSVAESHKSLEIGAHASFGISSAQEIGDHGDAGRSGADHLRRAVERHSSNRDDREVQRVRLLCR